MTELEGCVLGVVWLRGPCTAYGIRQEFLRSGSSYWSGSAGAIYPLLRRMEDQKLIRFQLQKWGLGRKKVFEITRAGMRALNAWIGPPLAAWAAKPTFDPIRTRFTFLGALSPAKRRRLIAEARAAVAAELAVARKKLQGITRRSQPFEALEVLAVIRELEGRARWLREAARSIGRKPS